MALTKEEVYLLNTICFYTRRNYTEYFDVHAEGNPHIHTVVYKEGPASSSFCHTHDYYELLYIYAGSCHNIVNGREMIMDAGSAILMAPGTVHSIVCEDETYIVNVLIRDSFFESTFAGATDIPPFTAFVSSQHGKQRYGYIHYRAHDLNSTVDEMLVEYEEKREGHNTLLDAMTSQIILSLNRYAREVTLSPVIHTDNMHIADVLEYMYDHFGDGTLSETAHHLGYSPKYLSRMVHRHTGKTYLQILNGLKLHHALEMLSANPKVTMQALYTECGFKNAEHFQRLFKREFGITIRQFQQTFYATRRVLSDTDSAESPSAF